jgi:hypothetical protein
MSTLPMSVTKSLSEEGLRRSIEDFVGELDSLAKSHYHLSGQQLLERLNTDEGRLQYARLLGVMIKKPFAAEALRSEPSPATKSYVNLVWKDRGSFANASQSWQFRCIKGLATNFEDVAEISDQQAVTFLEDEGRTETNLGKSLFKAFHDGICGDPKASKAVSEAIKKAKEQGIAVVEPSAAGISVGIASVVSLALATVLPVTLAAGAAPVLGGIALFLLQTGVRGFCDWSGQASEKLRSAEEETEPKQPHSALRKHD